MTEVGIGTAIVAYIEPHAGQALEFNRWYERDHFYAATTAGPGAFSGARWVATRACKAVRPPGATWFGDAARGSFLTTVWLLDGKQAEWDAWVAKEMEELRAEPDRMFPGRDHVHTAVYRYCCEVRADDAPSAAVALDHGFAGVVAIVVPPGAESAEGCAREIAGPQIPVVVGLTPERAILSQADPPPHALVFGFTPGDPLDAWRSRVEPALARLPSVGFASPFLRTIPGTDAHVDDI
jgi:hypothetical protein